MYRIRSNRIIRDAEHGHQRIEQNRRRYFTNYNIMEVPSGGKTENHHKRSVKAA